MVRRAKSSLSLSLVLSLSLSLYSSDGVICISYFHCLLIFFSFWSLPLSVDNKHLLSFLSFAHCTAIPPRYGTIIICTRSLRYYFTTTVLPPHHTATADISGETVCVCVLESEAFDFAAKAKYKLHAEHATRSVEEGEREKRSLHN